NDWDAVGGLHRKQQAGCAGDNPVSGKRQPLNAGYAVNQVRMNLAQGDQWPGALCKAFHEGISSEFDGQPGGMFRESKITVLTCTEAGNQPGEFLESQRLGISKHLSRHVDILMDGLESLEEP